MPYPLKDSEHPLHCLECGEPLVYGRPDRKFCSVACKNKYHNRQAYPVRGYTARQVMRILDCNHNILVKLIHMGIRSMDLPSLSNLGFDTRYLTSFQKQNGHNVCTCLDIVYELTPSRIKKIAFLREEVGQEADEEAMLPAFSAFSADP